MDYTHPVSDDQLSRTRDALKANGISSVVAETADEARQEIFKLLPNDAEVMTMTSVTLDTLGVTKEINESGKYKSVREHFKTLDDKKDVSVKQKLGAAPDYAIGSVHAITEDGKVVIASNTGSQLPAYVYGAQHVIWVVGTQKIVPNLDAALKRVYDHVLPLESKRAHEAYGVPGSFVSKLLIINKEINPQRLTIVFVKQALGF